MVKPIDITRTVIVPKPAPSQEKIKSFFIGRAPRDEYEEDGVEVQVKPKEQLTQPHLDNSVVKDTEWTDLY